MKIHNCNKVNVISHPLDSSGGLGTAIPGIDYEFPTINETSKIFNFTISPGTTRSFEVVIIDDSIAEFHRKFIFYNLFVYSTGIDYIGQRNILIVDNDG